MTQTIKLSKRLQTIHDLVSYNNVVADIGSDHALLPIALVSSGKATRAYASEVNEGPYDMSVANIEKYGLQNYIVPVLSDGISELEADVSCITICGMGGNLIADILEKDKEKLTHVNEIIIEPNNNEETARIWLANNGYVIEDEKIVFEDEVYYEIIKAVRGKRETRYTKEELYFGPVLLQEKSQDFLDKWRKYKDYLNAVLVRIHNPELSNYKMIEGLIKLIDKTVFKQD